MTRQTDSGPVLQIDDPFRFRCGKSVPCFNECCRDVTIFLGPYDVLRLCQGLGMPAKEFLEKRCVVLGGDRLLPLVVLKMNEADEKRCFFVTPEGCSVYAYRPWACRMFPLDITEKGGSFRVIIDDARCQGLREDLERPVRDYLNDQGAPKYQVMDDLMGELINDARFKELDIENEQIRQMIFMALYTLDEFRKFVFDTSFLEKFDIEPRRLKRLKRDDEELLRLAYDWVAFGLVGRKTLQLKQELIEKAKKAGGGEEP